LVLSGHRDTFFRPLRGIRSGDRIKMVTPAGSYLFEVDWTAVVDPADIAPLKATPNRSMTLVTCYPFSYVGPAPRRFIVRARQVVPATIGTESD
jgi:sortase A